MWVLNGVGGSEASPPACAGTYKGALLIMGSASCVWEDIEKFEQLNIKHDRMAVNYTGMFCWDMEHWVSEHPEIFRWLPMLKLKMCNNLVRVYKESDEGTYKCTYPGMAHTNRPDTEENIVKTTVWHGLDIGGTSSMFGVRVGIALGYDKIILAGVPLDGAGYFFLPPTKNISNHGDRATQITWERQKEFLSERVRAMSGFTKNLLGEPTKEWLNGF